MSSNSMWCRIVLTVVGMFLGTPAARAETAAGDSLKLRQPLEIIQAEGRGQRDFSVVRREIGMLRGMLPERFRLATPIAAFAENLLLSDCQKIDGLPIGMERRDGGLNGYLTWFTCRDGSSFTVTEMDYTKVKARVISYLPEVRANIEVNGQPGTLRHEASKDGWHTYIVNWRTADQYDVHIEINAPANLWGISRIEKITLHYAKMKK